MGGNAIEELASSFTQDDILLISNALNEILNGPDAIDELEFQTRLGVDRDVAADLHDRVKRVYRSFTV